MNAVRIVEIRPVPQDKMLIDQNRPFGRGDVPEDRVDDLVHDRVLGRVFGAAVKEGNGRQEENGTLGARRPEFFEFF